MAAYNDAAFRQQFPAFASTASYPEAVLSFAWEMGANWFSTNQASWGVGSQTPSKIQQAADLMCAVIVTQLYGSGQTGGAQNTSAQGQAPGPLSGMSEGSVSASFALPAIGSSAFRSMLLASPPYGPLLLALLRISASIGPYISSGRPAYIPP